MRRNNSEMSNIKRFYQTLKFSLKTALSRKNTNLCTDYMVYAAVFLFSLIHWLIRRTESEMSTIKQL